MVVFKRVLVCGGSRSTSWSDVLDSLDRLALKFRHEAALHGADVHITIIHEGRTRGVGGFADGWAVTNKASTDEFPDEWMPPGPARNRSIIKLGRPDVVLAFVGDPLSLDLISRARKAGIEVHLFAASRREGRGRGSEHLEASSDVGSQ